MLLMPAVLEKRMLILYMGFLVFDNWVAGPDQTEVVNVQGRQASHFIAFPQLFFNKFSKT